MRVLVVHNRYRSEQPSGENTVVDREVELLRGAGHRVEVFERRSDDIAGRSLPGKAAVPLLVPWNPAVLEQRIARIHRMGQARPVRVINFVSKGTIEEGMLSVLAFKRSLSAGILDGGNGEILLGG